MVIVPHAASNATALVVVSETNTSTSAMWDTSKGHLTVAGMDAKRELGVGVWLVEGQVRRISSIVLRCPQSCASWISSDSDSCVYDNHRATSTAFLGTATLPPSANLPSYTPSPPADAARTERHQRLEIAQAVGVTVGVPFGFTTVALCVYDDMRARPWPSVSY